MTDRELLEAAARAAGMKIGYEPGCWFQTERKGDVALYSMDKPATWNPRDDDGDALRLAVDLRLTVLESSVRTPAGDVHNVFPGEAPDRFAATRLAIVRAAAALAPQGVPSE